MLESRHAMTFAEIIVLIIVIALLCYLMRPLQRRLEDLLFRFFKKRNPKSNSPVIDITDYQKMNQKKKDPEQK